MHLLHIGILLFNLIIFHWYVRVFKDVCSVLFYLQSIYTLKKSSEKVSVFKNVIKNISNLKYLQIKKDYKNNFLSMILFLNENTPIPKTGDFLTNINCSANKTNII